MQRYLRERGFSRCSQSTKNGMIIMLMCIVMLIYWFAITWSPDVSPWEKYQRAKADTYPLRSTICRIEDIIVEETRSDQNETAKKTSAKGFFVLRVVNSTNEQDQFKVEEVPLVHQPGQLSLVNSTVTCFYDPAGIRQARMDLSNLAKAKHEFISWCLMTLIVLSGCVWFGCFYMFIALKKIYQFLRSRHRIADLIPMEPINFA